VGEAQVTVPAPRAAAPARQKSAAAAELDLARLQQAGYLVPTSTRTLLAEELRHIKRQLLKNARDAFPGAGRMAQIMVTSALPGEGKTFFSINLAISMAAEVDRSVLLVDADVIHPTLFQRVGLQPGEGLQDLLMNPEIDVSDLVLETNVPKLSLLSAGTRNDRATELLASDSMEVLLARLETRFPQHVILFDGPPLLVTNEAKVLATRVGQVVMVVEANKTARNAVAQAFACVEHCPVVLSVLNKAPQTHTPLGYGYYYP
jgi:receptor protein-tyrosine kinase